MRHKNDIQNPTFQTEWYCLNFRPWQHVLYTIRFSAQVTLGKMKTLVNKMMGLNRLYGLAFVTLLVVQVWLRNGTKMSHLGGGRGRGNTRLLLVVDFSMKYAFWRVFYYGLGPLKHVFFWILCKQSRQNSETQFSSIRIWILKSSHIKLRKISIIILLDITAVSGFERWISNTQPHAWFISNMSFKLKC